MPVELKDRVCIVTGGNSGVGRATAIDLAKRGMKVVIAARRADKNEEVLGEVKAAGGEAVAVQCDVGDTGQVKAMVGKAVDAFGTVDALINNAGMRGRGRLSEVTDDHWDLILRTHLFGTFYCSREAYRVMQEKGRGHIVNISSVAAHWPDPRELPYGTAKMAQVKFTAHTWYEFQEYANAGKKEKTFFVHALMPIGINTPFSPGGGKSFHGGRKLEPEEVAMVIRDVLANPTGDRAFFEKLYEGEDIHIHAFDSVALYPYVMCVGLKSNL